jgi:hypothetical protein
MNANLSTILLATCLLIALAALPACQVDESQAVHDGQDMQSAGRYTQKSSLTLALEDCDIDIRPLMQKVNPQQHFTLKYVPVIPTQGGGGQQILSLVATYERTATKLLNVWDTNNVKLGVLKAGDPVGLVLMWPADHTQPVEISGGASPSLVAPGGTYNASDRRSAPTFEEEDAANDEKVRIRCQHRGKTISLIVGQEPMP